MISFFDYAKSKNDYADRMKKTIALYENVEGYKGAEGLKKIEREVVADLAGDYFFQDAEFVKRLTTNRKLYQKIFDEIKYMLSIVKAGSEEERKLLQAKKTFENAYNADTKARAKTKADGNADGKTTTQFALEYAGGTPYVRTERNSFVKEDGTPMTEREVFNSLVEGDPIPLPGGEVKVVRSLPGKDMYNELYKRRPTRYQNVDNIKQLNSEINYNMGELLENSETILENDPDKNGKHKAQWITAFDTQKVNFYDGSKAYNIELSVGVLASGEKVAYAKKFSGYDEELTKKIQATETPRFTNTGANQQPVLDTKIPQNGEDVKRETANSDQTSKNVQTFSLSDSDGNTLTDGQRNYFKNSKVVDENGNLKVMYHGTSNGGFTVFDTYGSNYGLFGQGSYFTDSKTIAESYTNKGKGNNKQVYKSYLNITNPLDMDAEANPTEWQNAFSDVDFPESGTNEQFYRAVEEYYADQMMPKWEVAEEVQGSIRDGMGYDGITHIGGGRVNADGERHRVYIAFDAEQVKNVDNQNPTDSPDIRYSLSECGTKTEVLKATTVFYSIFFSLHPTLSYCNISTLRQGKYHRCRKAILKKGEKKLFICRVSVACCAYLHKRTAFCSLRA